MVARETQGLNPTCATHPRTHCARDDGSQDHQSSAFRWHDALKLLEALYIRR